MNTNTITPKQDAFIRTLLEERAGDTHAEALRSALNLLREHNRLSKAAASETIDQLLKIKVTPKKPAVVPSIPEGHYAVPSSSGNNDYDFFRVDVPTKGKWLGYTFVKRVVGGHPDMRVPRNQCADILARIEEYGTEESGQMYAKEIGRCRRCNRHLTDEDSRIGRNGYGATCFEKIGGGA